MVASGSRILNPRGPGATAKRTRGDSPSACAAHAHDQEDLANRWQNTWRFIQGTPHWLFAWRVWGVEALGKHPRSTSKTSAKGKLKLGLLKKLINIYIYGFPCPGQRYAKGQKGTRSSIHGGCSKGDSQKGRANPQDISMLAIQIRTHKNPVALSVACV